MLIIFNYRFENGQQDCMTDDTSEQTEQETNNVATEHRSLIDHVSNMANYNKWKKQKLTTLRLRKELPGPQPLAVCFSLADNAKAHFEVKTAVENQIGCSVCKIQFDPVGVHALDSHAKSRWVLTLPNKESCTSLISAGLNIDGETTEVRYLDEAFKEEYEAYKLYQLVQRGLIRMPSYNNGQRKKKKRRAGVVNM